MELERQFTITYVAILGTLLSSSAPCHFKTLLASSQFSFLLWITMKHVLPMCNWSPDEHSLRILYLGGRMHSGLHVALYQY